MSSLGSGISSLFGGGGGSSETPVLNDPGGLQDFCAAPIADAAASYTPGGGAGGFLGSLASGAGDWFGSLVNNPQNLLGTLGKVGQLGATGMGIASSIEGQKQAAQQVAMQKQAQQRLSAAAAPAVAAGGQLTPAGSQALQGGALPPELEAQVQQWKQRAIAEMNDRLAKMGITDSTMQQQYLMYIDQQEQIQRGQLAGQLYSGGLQGIQTGTGPESAVLSSATGQAARDQGALANASQNIFRLMGAT